MKKSCNGRWKTLIKCNSDYGYNTCVKLFGCEFLLGQNKGLIRPGDTILLQILELRDAERRFGPKLEPLACYGCKT